MGDYFSVKKHFLTIKFILSIIFKLTSYIISLLYLGFYELHYQVWFLLQKQRNYLFQNPHLSWYKIQDFIKRLRLCLNIFRYFFRGGVNLFRCFLFLVSKVAKVFFLFVLKRITMSFIIITRTFSIYGACTQVIFLKKKDKLCNDRSTCCN